MENRVEAADRPHSILHRAIKFAEFLPSGVAVEAMQHSRLEHQFRAEHGIVSDAEKPVVPAQCAKMIKRFVESAKPPPIRGQPFNSNHLEAARHYTVFNGTLMLKEPEPSMRLSPRTGQILEDVMSRLRAVYAKERMVA